jgi:hypothetical protein
MKHLGRVALFVGVALAARALPAAADPPIWYCDLTGAGYQYFDRDGYQVCMDSCFVTAASGQTTYGECWLTPPPPPPPPGDPDHGPPGGPDNQS